MNFKIKKLRVLVFTFLMKKCQTNGRENAKKRFSTYLLSYCPNSINFHFFCLKNKRKKSVEGRIKEKIRSSASASLSRLTYPDKKRGIYHSVVEQGYQTRIVISESKLSDLMNLPHCHVVINQSSCDPLFKNDSLKSKSELGKASIKTKTPGFFKRKENKKQKQFHSLLSLPDKLPLFFYRIVIDVLLHTYHSVIDNVLSHSDALLHSDKEAKIHMIQTGPIYDHFLISFIRDSLIKKRHRHRLIYLSRRDRRITSLSLSKVKWMSYHEVINHEVINNPLKITSWDFKNRVQPLLPSPWVTNNKASSFSLEFIKSKTDELFVINPVLLFNDQIMGDKKRIFILSCLLGISSFSLLFTEGKITKLSLRDSLMCYLSRSNRNIVPERGMRSLALFYHIYHIVITHCFPPLWEFFSYGKNFLEEFPECKRGVKSRSRSQSSEGPSILIHSFIQIMLSHRDSRILSFSPSFLRILYDKKQRLPFFLKNRLQLMRVFNLSLLQELSLFQEEPFNNDKKGGLINGFNLCWERTRSASHLRNQKTNLDPFILKKESYLMSCFLNPNKNRPISLQFVFVNFHFRFIFVFLLWLQSKFNFIYDYETYSQEESYPSRSFCLYKKNTPISSIVLSHSHKGIPERSAAAAAAAIKPPENSESNSSISLQRYEQIKYRPGPIQPYSYLLQLYGYSLLSDCEAPLISFSLIFNPYNQFQTSHPFYLFGSSFYHEVINESHPLSGYHYGIKDELKGMSDHYVIDIIKQSERSGKRRVINPLNSLNALNASASASASRTIRPRPLSLSLWDLALRGSTYLSLLSLRHRYDKTSPFDLDQSLCLHDKTLRKTSKELLNKGIYLSRRDSFLLHKNQFKKGRSKSSSTLYHEVILLFSFMRTPTLALDSKTKKKKKKTKTKTPAFWNPLRLKPLLFSMTSHLDKQLWSETPDYLSRSDRYLLFKNKKASLFKKKNLVTEFKRKNQNKTFDFVKSVPKQSKKLNPTVILLLKLDKLKHRLDKQFWRSNQKTYHERSRSWIDRKHGFILQFEILRVHEVIESFYLNQKETIPLKKRPLKKIEQYTFFKANLLCLRNRNGKGSNFDSEGTASLTSFSLDNLFFSLEFGLKSIPAKSNIHFSTFYLYKIPSVDSLIQFLDL